MNPRQISDLVTLHQRTSGRFDLENETRARAVTRSSIVWWQPGWLVMLSTIMLCLVGVYCINITSGLGTGEWTRTALRQGIFAVIGIIGAALVVVPHYRRMIHFSWPLAALMIALLIFLLIPFIPESIVRPRNGGARRWINIGITEFQPSELAKIAFVLVMASYLRFRRNHRSIRGLFLPSLIAFVPMALILVQPDLGTAVLFMPALVAMLIAAGAKLRHLFSALGLGAVFAIVVVVLSLFFAQQNEYPLLRPHQVDRIAALIDQFEGDERHIQDRGFQGKQAITLVGAGGIAGHPEPYARALIVFSGLPERHNDMIFAVFANRFGLIGIMVLLVLYAAWVGGALWVAAMCRDPFGRLVCVGLAAMVATQAGVNVGMTIGLLPITGMTLPFVSYGGTSLVAGFLMAGLILNIALRRPAYLSRKSFEFDDDAE